MEHDIYDSESDIPETWGQAYSRYNDFLNEQQSPVTINGATYYLSNILSAVDPIAYRVGFNDWADAEGIDTDDLED